MQGIRRTGLLRLAAALAVWSLAWGTPAGAQKIVVRGKSGQIVVNDDDTVIVRPGGFVRDATDDAIDGEVTAERVTVIVEKGGRIRGGGTDDGVDIESGTVDVWGLVEGGDDAIEIDENDGRVFIRWGGAAIGGVEGIDLNGGKVFNWGKIYGGERGIDFDSLSGRTKNGFLVNYRWGTIRGAGNQGVRVTGNPDGRFRAVNYGLIQGPIGMQIQNSIPTQIMNDGVIRGLDEFGVFLQNSSGENRLRYGGSGTVVGGVEGGAGDGDTLVLDGLKGVPIDVARDVRERAGGLGGDIWLGPKFGWASGFERLEIQGEGILSWEEISRDGLASVGRAFDWAAPMEVGPTLMLVSGIGGFHGRDDINKAFATASSLNTSHAIRDAFWDFDYYWSRELQGYFDDRLQLDWNAARAGTKPESDYQGWVRSLGVFSRQSPNSDRERIDGVTHGVFAGIDRQIRGGDGSRLGTLVGGYAGYTRTEFDTDSFDSDFHSDDIHLGIYGSMKKGLYQGSGSGRYTYHQIDTKRSFQFGDFVNRSKADPSGHQFSMFWNNALVFELGDEDSNCYVAPEFGFDYSYLHIDSYKENGGPGDLAVDDQDDHSFSTILGLKTGTQFSAGGFTFRPEGYLQWRHQYLQDDDRVGKQFRDLQIDPFSVTTQHRQRDMGQAGIGISGDYEGCDCLSFSAGFDHQFGDDDVTQRAVRASVKWKF